MRKLFAIFIICSTILYGIMLCYADEQSSSQKDLPLPPKYETERFYVEAERVLAEQKKDLDTLYSFYYLGYDYRGSFDIGSLESSLSWSGQLKEDAPIYKSEIYKNYYKIRTKKALLHSGSFNNFDFSAFTKTARQEFDTYIKSAVKNEADKTKLVILLQEKLMDELLDIDSAKGKAALDGILSLRLLESEALCHDYIYQIFENRVRYDIYVHMIEFNKAKLAELASDIAINISAERKCSFFIKYKNSDEIAMLMEILNTSKEDDKYCGFTVLYELYGKKDSSLIFIDDAGHEYSFEVSKALETMSLDHKGYIQLKLEDLLKKKETDDKSLVESEKKTVNNSKQEDEQLEILEVLYYSKAAKAQDIIKELNRFGIYLELKNNNIQNNYTAIFEAQGKQWKKALEGRLESFGPGGIADFASFIKQFVLLGRSEFGNTEKGRMIISKFRNSVIQFRQLDECSLWITDMLYNLKYMK